MRSKYDMKKGTILHRNAQALGAAGEKGLLYQSRMVFWYGATPRSLAFSLSLSISLSLSLSFLSLARSLIYLHTHTHTPVECAASNEIFAIGRRRDTSNGLKTVMIDWIPLEDIESISTRSPLCHVHTHTNTHTHTHTHTDTFVYHIIYI
jgi:hypothetical protein